jgi:hypothetical protein
MTGRTAGPGCNFGLRLAEGVGFEPTIRLPVYTLSRRAPSTTRPPLRSFSRHPSRRILRSGADRTPKARRAKPDQPKRLASTCRFLRTSPIDKRALAKIKPSPMATTLIAEPSARGAITSAAERACANYPPVLLPPRQRRAEAARIVLIYLYFLTVMSVARRSPVVEGNGTCPGNSAPQTHSCATFGWCWAKLCGRDSRLFAERRRHAPFEIGTVGRLFDMSLAGGEDQAQMLLDRGALFGVR